MSRENLPARASLTASKTRGFWGTGKIVLGRRAVPKPVVGDPDGSKARAAGARGRSTPAMNPAARAWAYTEQNGRKVDAPHTPKQLRRMIHKINRMHKRGMHVIESKPVASRVAGYRADRVIVDEVTA